MFFESVNYSASMLNYRTPPTVGTIDWLIVPLEKMHQQNNQVAFQCILGAIAH
jgi:hypothetical protein